MGFENLRQAIDEGVGLTEITAEELLKEQLADETALKLVRQNATVAERFLQSKQIPAQLDKIDELYRSAVKADTWANGKPRAALPTFTILEAIENIASQIHMAFFSSPQPFSLGPKGKTTPTAARAMSKILCWAIKQSGSKEEFRKVLKSILQYPQGVGKFGWQVGETQSAEYKYEGEGESRKVTKHLERDEVPMPTFEWVDLRNILVDPALRCHDIRLAKYVIHQSFVTLDDLEDLAAAGYNNVPTREEMIRILVNKSEPTANTVGSGNADSDRQYQAERPTAEASADPTLQPLELLEYWDNERVITVLQRKIVLRNEDNEFGRLPFVSCSFVDVLGSWFGFSITKLLEGEQAFQIGVSSLWIDGLSLSLNPMWHRKKGLGQSSQTMNSSPGRVVNDDGDLAPLEVKSNTQEALGALQMSDTRANRRVGANFGSNMPTQALRTAEGVNDWTSGVQTRLQYFIETYSDLVFIPVLEAFIQLCKDNLQPEQINAILTEQEGKEYEGNVLEIFNGGYSLEVLSSTKLAARRAMAALIPQLVNLFSADPVQQGLLAQKKKVDFGELVQQVIDLTGWPVEGLIVDATDEDIQRAMQMNQAAIKAQSDMQLQAQKHQNDMELEDEKATGRAGIQVVRHLLDGSKPNEPLPNQEGTPLANKPKPE